MQITTSEYWSLLPLIGLSGLYFLKDKYMFNRRGEHWWSLTNTQVSVLFMYPLWIFLAWVRGLQINRVHILPALFTTTSRSIVSNLCTVGMLNDTFRLTEQQLTAFSVGLMIDYLGTTYYLLLANSGEQQVDHVVNETRTCQ